MTGSNIKHIYNEMFQGATVGMGALQSIFIYRSRFNTATTIFSPTARGFFNLPL